MKNDEKLDIQIGEPIPDDLPAVAKAKQFYATAYRYIEISKYMKKYEDRDKYLHRGIRYMKKCYPHLDVRNELRTLRLTLFRQRAEGRIELYEEAEKILKTAKNDLDYSAAFDLYQRIHKHELTHSIPAELIDPDLHERWSKCMDSEEKMKYCEEQKEKFLTKNKKKSRVTSAIVLVVMIALLLFSTTDTFSIFAGDVLTLTGNYALANQEYTKVYEKTKNDKLIDKLNNMHYLAGQDAAKAGDLNAALNWFSYTAKNDYKDSTEQILSLEKRQIADAKVGNEVTFGGNGQIKWYVLEKQGNKALLFKKYALDKNALTVGMTHIPAFDTTGNGTTWETSSLRAWLNNEYLHEKFSATEISAIVDTKVVAEDNETYKTSAGNDTIDKIYLPSANEYSSYSYLFHQTESDWWTRTPGNEPGTMTYVNRYKVIMDYGYKITDTHLATKPVMWVDFSQ